MKRIFSLTIMTTCPALISNLSTPKVLWSQTDVSVSFRILLVDVDDYFLLVDQEHLRFSTTTKDGRYYLCLYLFGAVIPEKCTHRNVQREIKVNIPKAHRWMRWPRLCLKKQHDPQITLDLDKVVDEEIVNREPFKREWDNWQDYKREHKITNIRPPTPSSDEQESDDEIMDALIDML